MSHRRRRVRVFRRLPVRGLAGGLALLALGASCGGSGDEVDPARASGADLTALRTGTKVALPVRLPPDLREISAVTGESLPLVSFYSTNQPLVTVCTGRLAVCRSLTNPELTLQSGSAGDVSVLVTVDRPEAPEADLVLSSDLRAFWSSVRLTTAAPDWLETDP